MRECAKCGWSWYPAYPCLLGSISRIAWNATLKPRSGRTQRCGGDAGEVGPRWYRRRCPFKRRPALSSRAPAGPARAALFIERRGGGEGEGPRPRARARPAPRGCVRAPDPRARRRARASCPLQRPEVCAAPAEQGRQSEQRCSAGRVAEVSDLPLVPWGDSTVSFSSPVVFFSPGTGISTCSKCNCWIFPFFLAAGTRAGKRPTCARWAVHPRSELWRKEWSAFLLHRDIVYYTQTVLCNSSEEPLSRCRGSVTL